MGCWPDCGPLEHDRINIGTIVAKIVTRDGHVGQVLDDWLRWRTGLVRQLEGEGWHSSKTKGATVNSMARMTRLLTTITTFSLGRKQELGLSLLLQFLLHTLHRSNIILRTNRIVATVLFAL